MKKLFLLAIMAIINTSLASTPCLLFLKTDIQALQNRVESENFKQNWQKLLSDANDLSDSKSKKYADPTKVTVGFENIAIKLRGHYFGRRLNEQMETLGLVYQLTGNKKYSDHGIAILTAYAKELPPSHIFMSNVLAGGRGDMMMGLATGYDMFAENMTSAQKAVVLDTARKYLDNFLEEANNPSTWWRYYHNYNGVCGGAAGCIAILLKDTDNSLSKEYIVKVQNIVTNWLDKGFDKQGAYLEGVSYSLYGLKNVVIFADALKRSGGDDLFKTPALKNVINFYVMSILPGEDFCEARNDSNYCKISSIALKLAIENNCGLANWVYRRDKTESFLSSVIWSNDVKTQTPEEANFPKSQYFQGRGLCVWRTGWDKEDVMFSIEAGTYYPVTHNQADKGQFTLYGLGYRWSVDAGYGNNRDPNGRAQTVAHNCILVDGKGQAISGAGLGTNGRIVKYSDTADYGYALADSTEAYIDNARFEPHEKKYFPKTMPTKNMDMDHAYRHVFFVKKTDENPAYAVILDDIQKDNEPHDYCWQMLTWPNLNIKITDSQATFTPESADAGKPKAQMNLYIDSESKVRLACDTYTPGDNREPKSYPRIRAYANANNPYFTAVLVPFSISQKPPVIKFMPKTTEKKISIIWPNRIDTITWDYKDKTSIPTIAIDKKISK